MSALLKLLFLSGRFLTSAAAKTLQEALLVSFKAKEYLETEYDRVRCVIEPHDNMLDLIQKRSDELSQIIGSEIDIHVAVIDSRVKVTLDDYFRSVNVPYIQVRKPGGPSQRDSTILLTLRPKPGLTRQRKEDIQLKKYSTQNDKKDLEFLKKQIKDKFKKLLSDKNENSPILKKRLAELDVSKTIKEMTAAQKYIIRDLNNLLKCLSHIEDLQNYLKMTGIENDTIHLLLMTESQKKKPKQITSSESIDDTPRYKRNICEEQMIDEIVANEIPHCLEDSYADYRSAKDRRFSKHARYDKTTASVRNEKLNKKLTPIYINRKRKRGNSFLCDSEKSSQDSSGETRKRGLEELIENSKPKQLYDELMRIDLNNRKERNDTDMLDESSSKKFKPDGNHKEDALSGENNSKFTFKPAFFSSSPFVTQSSVRPKLSKNAHQQRIKNTMQDTRKLTQRQNDNTTTKSKEMPKTVMKKGDNTFEELEVKPSYMTNSNLNFLLNQRIEASQLMLSNEKHYRKVEMRISKRIKKAHELEKAQYLKSQQEEIAIREGSDNENKHLNRMKRLEEHVVNETKSMFFNKRHFQDLERKLKYKMFKEKKAERERELLKVNNEMFAELEKRLARKRILLRLQVDVENVSRMITENYLQFNRFQRRMLHSLINNIEPNARHNSPTLRTCGKEVVFLSKDVFNIVAEKLEHYSTFSSSQNDDTLASKKLDCTENENNVKSIRTDQYLENNKEKHEKCNLGMDHVNCENNEAKKEIMSKNTDETEKKANANKDLEHTVQVQDVNHKVFEEFEKVLSTTRLIEQIPKFSTNKSDEECGKLLQNQVNVINDADKRNIYTGQVSSNKNKKQQNKILQRSKSDIVRKVSVVNPFNQVLCEQMLEKSGTPETAATSHKVAHQMGMTPLPLNFDTLISTQNTPEGNYEVVPKKSATRTRIQDTTKGELNNMSTTIIPKKPIKVKLDVKQEPKSVNAINFAQKIKLSRIPTLNIKPLRTKESSPSPVDYKKVENKHQLLNTKKIKEEVTCRQRRIQAHTVAGKKTPKQTEKRKAGNAKGDSHKSTDVNEQKSQKLQETRKRDAALQRQALKHNSFIKSNSNAASIDKDLEKKLTQKNIELKKYAFPKIPPEQPKVPEKNCKSKITTNKGTEINCKNAQEQVKHKEKAAALKAEKANSKITSKCKNEEVATKHESNEEMTVQSRDKPAKSSHSSIGKKTAENTMPREDKSKFERKPSQAETKMRPEVSKEMIEAISTELPDKLEENVPCSHHLSDLQEYSDAESYATEDSFHSTLSLKTLFESSGFGNDGSPSESLDDDDSDPLLITSSNCRQYGKSEEVKSGKSEITGKIDSEAVNLNIELMDDKDIAILSSQIREPDKVLSQVKQKQDKDGEIPIELQNTTSEIVSKKFDRKPWGTNVINQVPSHIKKTEDQTILPKTTIWSQAPKTKVGVPPKQKKAIGDRKYKYHTKEVVMGNKVTKVTYLVEE